MPVANIYSEEATKLLDLEAKLHRRVVGQDEAVIAVADALRRSRSGLGDGKRPIGTFLFLGPTGVGKTELAKALAEFVFDADDALLRLDMSEYMEPHTVSRLFGSPPGYVGFDQGGQLTEAVRRRPYQVILFDEVEKAHPEIFNALLQILDDGRLTDGHGRTVDFRNTIIIMTSNVGTSGISLHAGPLGFRTTGAGTDDTRYEEMRTRVLDSLKKAFRPEFLNRIDEILVFNRLTRPQLRHVVDKIARDLHARLEAKQIGLTITDAASDWLLERGYDETFGARRSSAWCSVKSRMHWHARPSPTNSWPELPSPSTLPAMASPSPLRSNPEVAMAPRSPRRCPNPSRPDRDPDPASHASSNQAWPRVGQAKRLEISQAKRLEISQGAGWWVGAVPPIRDGGCGGIAVLTTIPTSIGARLVRFTRWLNTISLQPSGKN